MLGGSQRQGCCCLARFAGVDSEAEVKDYDAYCQLWEKDFALVALVFCS